MDKDNIYTHNGILLSLKEKEILLYVTTWMNLEDVVLSEISQSQKDCAGLHLYEVSQVIKLKETESRMMVARGWGGQGEMNGYRVSVMQDEKV